MVAAYHASPVSPFSVIQMILVFLCYECVIELLLSLKCIRSHSNWCRSLSKWMSVSSSHLGSSDSHISPHSSPISSEVPSTRWFNPFCLPIIWEFLYHHWPGTWHNVHSHSVGTDTTWIWGFLLHTHGFN